MTSPARLTARIRFFADWQVGSGRGLAAAVDRRIVRDGDGLPIVPAKTLTGIWRDAAEQLATGLDDGRRDGPWSRRVNELFGSQPGAAGPGATGAAPSPAVLSIRPARLSPALAQRLRDPRRAALAQALTTVRAGVRIDTASGTALDDHLRFDEVARAGLTLAAAVELDTARLTADEVGRLVALLTGSAAFVDAIGAGRRRGLGGCVLTVEPGEGVAALDDDALLALLGTEPPASVERPVERDEAAPARSEPTSDGESELVTLRLEVRADGPLLMRPTVTGNHAAGVDAIPGAALLGIAARAIDSVLGAGATAAAIPAGEIVVTSARPIVGGRPGLPMPLCLGKFKDGRGFKEPGGVRNAFAEADAKQPGQGPQRQLKGLRRGWIAAAGREGELPVDHEPKIVHQIHNAVEDERQRPTERTGGLYTYAAVAAGERFEARLHLSGSLARRVGRLVDEVATALSGTARIGRSKKDDYGAVAITAFPHHDEADTRLKDLAVGSSLPVLLLDELVAVDAAGVPAPTAEGFVGAVVDALVAAGASADLELAVASAAPAADRPGPPSIRLRAGRLDDWNVGWGLPRPSLPTLSAGSCAILKVVRGSVPAAALATVEWRGAGERTAEGLGALRFADPWLTSAFGDRAPATVDDDEPLADDEQLALDEGDHAVAQIIEDAAWRDAIVRAALLLAQSGHGSVLPDLPRSRTQLAGLRAATADPRGAAAGLVSWLPAGTGAAAGKDEAAAQRKRARKRGWTGVTLRRIEALATGDDVWDLLDRALHDALGEDRVVPEARGEDRALPGALGEDLTLARTVAELRAAHRDLALRAVFDAILREQRHPDTEQGAA